MDELLALLGDHGQGNLVTLKRDGRPQISIVSYAYDAEARIVRISVTDGRAKTRNLRRDPRASIQVMGSHPYPYIVVEGDAELTPVAADAYDETVEELIDVYRQILGEHANWDEYRAAMVADKRLVIRLPVAHVYGPNMAQHV